MEDQRLRGSSTSSTASAPPLHTLRHARRTTLNLVFMAVYTCAILAHLHQNAHKLIQSTTLVSFFITLSFFISDIILAIVWAMLQCFRVVIVYRSEFPENLEKVMKKSDFPALDVFRCTADPYKEPPIRLVSTALSVMAYDYPTEKISVYVSDDGGSQLTLFAYMEAAKFASHWLPFCRKTKIIDRSPEAYFASIHSWSSDAEKIKVLLESSKNKHITDHLMPNLVYLSREKSKTSFHHFKADALNVLLRVSAAMTNAPIILTLDCDMYSNDPQTPLRALCYLLDPKLQSKVGYVQFPQMFYGINKNDTYGSEYKRIFQINPMGMDGLLGPSHVGTGCYFNRRIFFGGPSTFISPEITKIGPYHVVDKPVQSQQIMDLAHKIAECNYENNTKWGFKMGFKYGSLIEDHYTGYRQHCEGWRSIFCKPKRPAFLGDAPISLIDGLNQGRRWVIGMMQVGFSKYSPISFGTRSMGLIMGLTYASYCAVLGWLIPFTIYAFLPQLALLNEVSAFPKIMYERMKVRIENVLELGKVSEEYITDVSDRRALSKWTDEFTHQDHSTIIKVLLESSKNKDITDHLMPNLIYLSREKSKTSSHHFKAGALNVLLRVSAAMTNAPIILTLDCDTYSNDPQTPLRTLCYLSDPKHQSKLGYVQFPQMFHGINKNDTYGSEYKRPFQTNPMGMDGLLGPNYVRTGCYFNRRDFFGGPSTFISPKITEISPYNLVNKPIQSQQILDLAHKVAGCNYENNTKWGFEMGFKYGSLVEDFYTGYWLKCDGWRSIFCNPKRPAFLGDAPISLIDGLIQCQRWVIGGIQVGFSKYSPITFGTRSMGLIMGLTYTYYVLLPNWLTPYIIYAFLPQLALLNEVSIFPKLSEPWFFLYVFHFLGAYGSDLLEFIVEGGTVQRWWNDQRMWMIRVLSSYLFASLEYFLMCLGISTYGFSLTNKVVDDEQRKRYDQGVFDFGVPSPMFVPITMAAIINLVSFFMGLMQVVKGTNSEGLFLQMFMAGFVVVNSMPIYEAIVLRRDKGRMPVKITTISTCLALSLYVLASQLLFI